MNGMLTPISAATILRDQAREQLERARSLSEAEIECAALDAKIEEMAAQEFKRAREDLKCDELAKDKDAAEAKAKELTKSANEAEDSNATYDARSLYWDGFNRIMDTAVRLAEVDAEQAKLRAEVLAANAEKKAKEAEEKAKTAEAEAKAATETLEALRTKALDDTLERAKCRDCKVNAAKNGQTGGNAATDGEPQ
jgi:hypothetical protein